MRLFYAAYLSQENMRAYQTLVDRLIERVPGTLRSVPDQTHHLTLAFLGEMAESDVDKCSAALDVVERFEAFDFSLGPPSILLGRGRPRLIRVSLTEGAERVARLQMALNARVREGIPSMDARSKPAHITLARFKKNARKSLARRVEDALAPSIDSSLPEGDLFSSVQLVQSSLTSSGPIYKTVREVRLATEI